MQSPSPELFTKTQMTFTPPPPLPSPSPLPPPVSQVQPTSQPTVSLPTSSGPLTLTIQQLQSLLAAQVSSGKTPVLPLSQLSGSSPSLQTLVPPAAPSTPSTDSPSASTPARVVTAYPCAWGNCTGMFEESADLVNHVLRTGPGTHISRDIDGNFYCYWANCPRHRELGGRPFDTCPKITRHVKEVHLLRVVPRQVPLEHLGANFHRKGAGPIKIASPLTIPSALASPQNSSVGGLPPIRLVNPMVASTHASLTTPQTVVTPARPLVSTSQLAISSLPKPTLPTTTTATVTTPQQVTSTVTTTTTLTPPSIYHTAPPNPRKVVHSSIYLK